MRRKSSTRRSSTDAAGARCLAARARPPGVCGCATIACVDGVPPAGSHHMSFLSMSLYQVVCM